MANRWKNGWIEGNDTVFIDEDTTIASPTRCMPRQSCPSIITSHNTSPLMNQKIEIQITEKFERNFVQFLNQSCRVQIGVQLLYRWLGERVRLYVLCIWIWLAYKNTRPRGHLLLKYGQNIKPWPHNVSDEVTKWERKEIMKRIGMTYYGTCICVCLLAACMQTYTRWLYDSLNVDA